MFKNSAKCLEFFVILVYFVGFSVLIDPSPALPEEDIPITPHEILNFMQKSGYLQNATLDSETLESDIIEAIKSIQKCGALNETGILDSETLRVPDESSQSEYVESESTPNATDEVEDSSSTYEGQYDYVDYDEDTTTQKITVTTEIYYDPKLCEGYFDAVTLFKGELLIFKKDDVWKLTENRKIMEGCPKKLREMFPFLPSDVQYIDAAYERDTDKSLVLFVGERFWVYDGNNLIDGSPKCLTDYGFCKTILKINAAMYWPKTNRTYLFGDEEYWRYDDKTQKLDGGCPKSMEGWNGIATGIDAATTLPDGTYFFKHNQYWRYNNDCDRLEEGYPRATSEWLGCPL